MAFMHQAYDCHICRDSLLETSVSLVPRILDEHYLCRDEV